MWSSRSTKSRDPITHCHGVISHNNETLASTVVEVPNSPYRPGSSHYRGFTITLRHTTVCKTPLDEWSCRSNDLYLATHNIEKRDIHVPEGFELAKPACKRPQAHTLERAASGICSLRPQRGVIQKREFCGRNFAEKHTVMIVDCAHSAISFRNGYVYMYLSLN